MKTKKNVDFYTKDIVNIDILIFICNIYYAYCQFFYVPEIT